MHQRTTTTEATILQRGQGQCMKLQFSYTEKFTTVYKLVFEISLKSCFYAKFEDKIISEIFSLVSLKPVYVQMFPTNETKPSLWWKAFLCLNWIIASQCFELMTSVRIAMNRVNNRNIDIFSKTLTNNSIDLELIGACSCKNLLISSIKKINNN